MTVSGLLRHTLLDCTVHKVLDHTRRPPATCTTCHTTARAWWALPLLLRHAPWRPESILHVRELTGQGGPVSGWRDHSQQRITDVGVLNVAVVADQAAGLVMVCVVVCAGRSVAQQLFER